jgi:hypothetical protein
MAMSVREAREAEGHSVDQEDAASAVSRIDAIIDDEWDGYNPVLIALNQPRMVLADPLAALFRPRVRRLVLLSYSRAGWIVQYDVTDNNVTGKQVNVTIRHPTRKDQIG